MCVYICVYVLNRYRMQFILICMLVCILRHVYELTIIDIVIVFEYSSVTTIIMNSICEHISLNVCMYEYIWIDVCLVMYMCIYVYHYEYLLLLMLFIILYINNHNDIIYTQWLIDMRASVLFLYECVNNVCVCMHDAY